MDSETSQAALISRTGAILIRVPDAARFAIHKLFVADERPAAFATRKMKDIGQADEILTVLFERNEIDRIEAAIAAARDYAGMLKRIIKSGALLSGSRDNFRAMNVDVIK